MKRWMSSAMARRAWLPGLLLLLVGIALLWLPRFIQPTSPPTVAPPGQSPLASPIWRPLPTRIPQVPLGSPPQDLLPLYNALLRGDLDRAAELWTDLLTANPDPDIDLYVAGIRLAMLRGQTNTAIERAWTAVGEAPADIRAWALLGIALRDAGEARQAAQVLAIAEVLEPALAPDLFNDRWRTALSIDDTTTLVELAADYAVRYPDSLWLPYYRAEALTATGDPLAAIYLLVPILRETPTSPALLWYALGRAYLERGGYAEAMTALEAAAARAARGDRSLDRISDTPMADLNIALGRSYLGARRCREAEAIFLRYQENDLRLNQWLDQAVVCQTPTPTLTPWIPKQIGTVTPRP